MANPYVAVADKTQLLSTAAGADQSADACFFDFIKLLVKNRRIDAIRAIALAYLDIYRTAKNIYPVTITSAAPLSDDADAKLHKIINQHLGDATAEYSTTTDPSLIGGRIAEQPTETIAS
jgi:F-type H+-transporting ATPase subunit delta